MKKGVVFVVVWGIIIMVSLFAIASVYLMGNQAFIGGHTTRRIGGYYTAKSAMFYTLDQLRQGIAPAALIGQHIIENNSNAVISNIGGVISNGGPFDGCRQVTITVTY